jgi:hypothetical protein
MNTDVFKGKWDQLRGAVNTQWDRLTDDDVDRTGGDAEGLIFYIHRLSFFDSAWRTNTNGTRTPGFGEP